MPICWRKKLGVGLEMSCVYSYSASVKMIEIVMTLLAKDSLSLPQSCL